MRSKISQIRKQKHSLLNSTTNIPEHSIFPKAQLNRRCSLPTPNSERSINIKTLENEDSNIYFSQYKKKKFIKNLVDGYFEDTYENTQDFEKEQPGTDRRKKSGGKKIRKLFEDDNGEKCSKELQRPSQELHKEAISNEKQTETTPPYLQLQLPSISEETHENSTLPIISILSSLPPIIPSKNTHHFYKSLTFENEVHRTYALFEEGLAKYRMREYKTTGVEVMRREEKAQKLGIEGLWKASKINCYTFESELGQPLKCLICKISPYQIASPKVTLSLHSTSYRSYLLSSNCINLFNLLHKLSSILLPVTSKLQNNKLSPSNIYIIQNTPYIDEWGYSSFKEQYQIQNKLFESRINPILKSEKEWLVTPEYLAPEILLAVLTEEQAEEEKIGMDEADIWKEWGRSDVWSLGITMLEIVTMVPIYIKEVCCLKNKAKNISRPGFLSTNNREINQIIHKQVKLSKNVQSFLQNEVGDEIPKELIWLIGKMLTFNPKDRITFSEIMKLIK